MSAPPPAPYLPAALAQVPRLLSRGDREPHSLTYGSFDRTHWAWKFTDFPVSRFQEAAYALAYLYRHPAPGNPLGGHRATLEWTRAVMTHWQSLQYANGSFDEAYPVEHCLAATAFTGFYVGEAYQLVADELPADDAASLRKTFARAGDWLCRNDEHHGVLSNHLAAAAAALHVIGAITGEGRYAARAAHFLERIYRHQSPEGWFEEYGGADPGYQTHGTFYLARIWQLTQDARLLERLQAATAFLKHFIHPDGTLGGEYGSRNTEFYFPAGFEILAPACPDAAAIAGFMRRAVQNGTAAGLAAVDAYNLLPMLNNYLFAAQAASGWNGVGGALPFQTEFERTWQDAGLHVRSTARYYAVVGLSKGGVVKLFEKGAEPRLALSDCGWWGEDGRGRISSQVLGRPAQWRRDGDAIEVTTAFARINQRVPTPWLFIAFRLFTLTAGRFAAFARLLKSTIVRLLVSRRRYVPLNLKRRIAFSGVRVELADEVYGDPGLGLRRLAPHPKFASIHMGSARYFQPSELAVADPPGLHGAGYAPEFSASGRVRRERSWP
jgi:hypothetical protein